jgi:hypothetical protein
MAERVVTCDLQMERETTIFFACLISTLRVRPLWNGRRQADDLSYSLQHVTADFWEGSDDFSSQLSQIF